MQPPALCTIADACRHLHVGRDAIYNLIRDGQLQSVKVGRSRRIVVASLDTLTSRLIAEQAAQ